MLSTLCVAALFAAGLLLIPCYRRVAETTLVGPWQWAVLTVAGLCLVQTILAMEWWVDQHAAIQWVAVTLSVCPFVALLGAKRPQHRAWHFIVFSLWVVLAIPAAESLWVRGGGAVELHALRTTFTCVILGLGWLNYLFTRFALAATLCTTGQFILFAPHLVRGSAFTIPAGWEVGSLLIAAAILVAHQDWFRPRRTGPAWNRAWCCFRDAYGAVWALRVSERLNASARRLDWNVRLRWSGFVRSDGHVWEQPSLEATVERCFRMLLRRFVANSWCKEG